MRCNRPQRRRALLGSIVAAITLIVLLAAAACADASTIGPFELSGSGLPAVQVSSLLAVGQAITHPHDLCRIRIRWPRGAELGVGPEYHQEGRLEQSALAHAVAVGTHYKKGSLALVNGGGSYEAICLTDAFPVSSQFQSAGGSSTTPEETVGIAYTKISFRYGVGANCNGTPSPPVESTLVSLNRSASMLTARVDCLIKKCRGILAVSLPSAACPAGASAAGSTGCSFTGGVRVGLDGGAVKFNNDGTAFTGGVKVGIGGSGNFSMGDGSVRVLQLPVPSPLRKWLKGHSHATLGSIIVVRGLGKAIVEREALDSPAKIYAAIPELTASEPNPTPPAPGLSPQSLLITECSTPVVGTPTVITVMGPCRRRGARRLSASPTHRSTGRYRCRPRSPTW